MIKLFIVGYPLDIQDAELVEMFSILGTVHSVDLVTDRITRKHKGFGFIEMENEIEAGRAIASLNGKIIKGRKITVKLADENRATKPRVFKENRFTSSETTNQPNDVTGIKSKRPRKLIN